MSFVHLRIYSSYSLAEGAIAVKKIPQLCKSYHMSSAALTDRHNLFGALEFSIECSKSGIQPIVGATLNISHNQMNTSLVVLAKNEQGYKNLMQLISKSYLQSSVRGEIMTTLDDLAFHQDGIIVLSGNQGGILGQFLLQNKYEEAKDLCTYFQKNFYKNWYIELNRHGLVNQLSIEKDLINIAFDNDVPLVATNEVFFSYASMHSAHDALLCIAEGKYINEQDRKRVTAHHYFKSSEEMTELFKDIPEAIEQTVQIAQRCSFMPLPKDPILPNFSTNSNRNQSQELIYQSELGLEQCLNEEVLHLYEEKEHEEVKKLYKNRLKEELDIIISMGFAGYFLIVSDFIKFAKSKSIPVGPGRGSGAGSLVAWSLMITDMDPIRFGLIFERFLNPERVSMPDFDIDFCQDRRDEVIAYVQERYGKDRVAHIITFGKFQARMAIKDVGRVLQIPYSQVDRVSKLIPFNPAAPITLEKALESEPLLKKHYDEDETIKNMIEIAKQLEGLYRHASTHAAGVVIADRSLTELVPLYKDDHSPLPATQFSMKYAEMAGLVKFDFLGLKTLTIISHIEKLIRSDAQPGSAQEKFSIRKIPLDDQKTFDLLSRVETIGIFQIESAGMRDVLRKLKPDRFEDLIALVALYRPGPMDDIPRYLACKHGHEPVTYLHPALEGILSATYGVMVYQEQVMKIAQVLGGYTLGAADLLRRAMGKKIKSEMDAQRQIFIKGAVFNGVEENIASLIFEQMAKFAGYGFNKSHSAPYALISYQTAYLKANYPLEFFAATMTCDQHNVEKINTYRQDLDKYGLTLLPPDINQSGVYFSKESHHTIRYGLSVIKGVGIQGVEHIIAEREKNGFFTSFEDFANRFDPHFLNKRQLEPLIGAGAFDMVFPNRHQLYAQVENILRHANYVQKKRGESANKQKSLFTQNGMSEKKTMTSPSLGFDPIEEWNLLEKLQKELESFGFYFSGHPLEAYEDVLKNTKILPSTQIITTHHTAARMVGVLMSKIERTSKNGNKFAFLQLSDLHGCYEVTLFSKQFAQYRSLLESGVAFLIDVSIKTDEEARPRLLLSHMEKLGDLDTHDHFYHLNIDDSIHIEGLCQWIKDLPSGTTQLRLCVHLKDIGVVTLTLPNHYAISATKTFETQSMIGVIKK